MRRSLATLALAVLTLPLLAACVFTAGPQVTEDRAVEEVRAVVLETAGDLTITRGEPKLTITAGTNVIDRLTSEIRDGVLYLDTRPGVASTWSHGEVRYELQLPTLESVVVEGSGDVDADFGEAADVAISIEGSGDIEATGATDRVQLSIEGSGDIDASDLIARDATASIEGSGEISVHATQTLDASIGGSGSISHSGGATVSSQIDGSGEIVED